MKTEDSNEIVQYNPVTAGLADLRQRYEGKIFDLTTVEGEKAARAAKREHVQLRTALETVRKEIKEPALRHCQLIDSEARRITTEILKTEEPIVAQIEAEEKRLREIDAIRVAAIETKINQACLVGIGSAKSTRAELEGWIGQLEAVTFDIESYEEFVDVAQEMHAMALERLRALLEQRLETDARAAQIEAEKAELERLKKEQAELDAIERARIAKEREAHEAKMKAERAEQERLASVARAEREEADRVAREKREAEAAEAKKAADAERVRLAQLREQHERDEAAAKAARDQADRNAAAARAEEDRIAREARAAEEKRIAKEEAEEHAADLRARNAAFAMLTALEAVHDDPSWLSISRGTQEKVESAIGLARGPAPIKP